MLLSLMIHVIDNHLLLIVGSAWPSTARILLELQLLVLLKQSLIGAGSRVLFKAVLLLLLLLLGREVGYWVVLTV